MKITAIYNWLSENLAGIVSSTGDWKIMQKKVDRSVNRAEFKLGLNSWTLVVKCLVLRNGSTTFIARMMKDGKIYSELFRDRLNKMSDWVDSNLSSAA